MTKLLPLIGIFLAATAGIAVKQDLRSVSVSNDDAASVTRFFEEWIQAERARDIDRLMNQVADDCVFLLPGQPPVKGKQAIRYMYERFFAANAQSTISHRVSMEDVRISGDYAFFWGVDELTVTPPGGGSPLKARGYGIGILKRAPNGQWMSFRSMNNMTREQPFSASGTTK